MKLKPMTLSDLATLLTAERKRQKLTRAQAAAVCNVSPSFIRDAETQPERCTLGKLVQLVNGLGLTMHVATRQDEVALGIIAGAMRSSTELSATEKFRLGLEEPRATDELRQTLSKGIIASARQDKP